MNRWREKIARFMIGRYGADELYHFNMMMIWILLLLAVLHRRGPWYMLAMLLMAVTVYRAFSRDYIRRAAENRKFLEIKEKVLGFFAGKKSKDANFRIYKCPGCGQKVRVPKGKGKISIRCPKCAREFVKRT